MARERNLFKCAIFLTFHKVSNFVPLFKHKLLLKKGVENIFFKYSAKGQLISKGHFGFNSPKKRTKDFCLSRLGQKFEFSSSFFGRIEDTKKKFRN